MIIPVVAVFIIEIKECMVLNNNSGNDNDYIFDISIIIIVIMTIIAIITKTYY